MSLATSTAALVNKISGYGASARTRIVSMIELVQKGAAGGVAPLNESGKIASIYLPSYVDDVEEFVAVVNFPEVGESGKIYIAINGGIPSDPSLQYRWSGSAYTEISPSPGTTDDVVEGASNLYFTDARATAMANAAIDEATEITVLVDAATLNIDLNVAKNYSLVIAGNRVLADPTNKVGGDAGVIIIKQDAVGGRTLTFNLAWKFTDGVVPSLTTTANAVDLLVYYVEDSGRITARMISDSK